MNGWARQKENMLVLIAPTASIFMIQVSPIEKVITETISNAPCLGFYYALFTYRSIFRGISYIIWRISSAWCC